MRSSKAKPELYIFSILPRTPAKQKLALIGPYSVFQQSLKLPKLYIYVTAYFCWENKEIIQRKRNQKLKTYHSINLALYIRLKKIFFSCWIAYKYIY